MPKIQIRCTQEQLDEVSERAELRGHDSMAEYVRTLITYGMLVEQVLEGEVLNADKFAGAFFAAAEHLMEIGARNVMQSAATQELKEWKTKEQGRLITGKVLRPAKKRR